MDQTQTTPQTPEQIIQTPQNVAEVKLAEGAKMESPEVRPQKTERATEIRTELAELDAKKRGITEDAQRDEAAAAVTQEGINRVLGQHNILDTVRNENAALAAIYARQATDLQGELTALEKRAA